MKKQTAKNPTIRDVATKAEVSVATVSRILNDLPGYTDETKQRVREVIQSIGYKPNALARGLVSRRTHTIGVLLPSISSRLAAALLAGIENVAHRREFSVIVCNTDSDGKRTMEYLNVLAEKQVEGIIFASEVVKQEYGREFEAMGIPVVLVSTFSPRFRLPYLKVDDRQAAYYATRYLIDKGHIRIGLISGTKSDEIAGTPRVEGFMQAMGEAGLSVGDGQIVYGDFAYRSGIACMERLLEVLPDITAIFAASDEMALGAMSCLYRQGKRIPHDISIIGYDDTQDAEMAIPPLTTVHQPIYEMGERAAEMLLSPEVKNEGIIMPFSIVERDSVRDVRQ